MADTTPVSTVIEQVESRLQRNIRMLERQADLYARNGMNALEFAKMVILSGYVLVRAIEPFEDVSNAHKMRAVEYIVPKIVNRYNMDIPGLPLFMDTMIRDMLLSLVVKAISAVLLGTHFSVLMAAEPNDPTRAQRPDPAPDDAQRS